jgi:hypothetical protein
MEAIAPSYNAPGLMGIGYCRNVGLVTARNADTLHDCLKGPVTPSSHKD